VFEGDLRRDLGAKVLGDADDPGVWAVGSDSVAWFEVLNTFSTGEDVACGGIPESDWLVEFFKDLLDGVEDALGAHLIDDLPDLVGTGAGFADEGLGSQIDDHFFGTWRDDAAGILNQDVTRSDEGFRDMCDIELTVANILNHLVHHWTPDSTELVG